MFAGLTSLFAGSLLASTIIPGGVEVLLYYMSTSGEYSWWALLITATAGNTIGGIITFFMGELLDRGMTRAGWYGSVQRFFKLSENALERMRKYGVGALFFSWLPIIGDPLCLAAGYLRLPFWPSALMILVGKFARYSVLLWIYAQPWATVP